MSKYVNTDKLLDLINAHHYKLADKNNSMDYGMFTVGIKQAIDEMPTADVVEIVRCKDCQYFRPYEEVEDFDGECIAHEIETDKTEFCSIGYKTKGKDKEVAKVTTNFEKIKSMTLEEMAESANPFFACPYGFDLNYCKDRDCIKCTKRWLERKVED